MTTPVPEKWVRCPRTLAEAFGPYHSTLSVRTGRRSRAARFIGAVLGVVVFLVVITTAIL